ncbi:DEAD/DEAH box helicase [Balneolaceae bacterium ANBcel3]|nr:DEAD/DEAH box helicase [Balneolaceae bacterium ANBcel3]
MDNLLKTWIAESESWQSFMDFDLPIEARANYPFLERVDDFYMSLMHRCLVKLGSDEYEDNHEEMLALAKGLEIYSLEKKRDYFKGVNLSSNILFAAGLYYLTGYSASAWILAKIYPIESYNNNLDNFISSFLKRNLANETEYSVELQSFLETGDFNILDRLLVILERQISLSFRYMTYNTSSLILARALLNKFYNENLWYDLLKFKNDTEYWKPLVSSYIKKKVPIWSFFPSQKAAIVNGVLSDKTYSLQMPTSSGKTSISEIIIYNEIKSKRAEKVLYLAPFRALASELKISLARNLATLGIKSKTIYGGNIPTAEERNSIEEVNLLIATPEKFMAIEEIFPDIHKEFNTIICDEGHLLDDSSRGLSYELLLSRLKEDKTHQKKFVFISAIIPNIDVINSWLGGTDKTLITSNYRPTELEFAFLKKMTSKTLGYYLDINPTFSKPKNYQLYRYLYDNELKITNPQNGRTSTISTKKGISSAVAIKATNSGSVALFAPHKRGHNGVEGLASEVLKQLEWKMNKKLVEHASADFIDSLVEFFSIIFGNDYLLVNSIRSGFLYHHGDFPQSVREIIEDSLRNGQIKLVLCTNTLAEGVNLPIKTIIIHDIQRFNPEVRGNYELINIRDLKNLVGRAGRAGKETKGLVIVPNSSDFNRIKDLINESNVEPVRGELYNIIHRITRALQNQRLQLTDEIMDELSDYFQALFDTIDLSMIDLLSEEVDSNNLSDLVQQIISQTLSYYQSDSNERNTLETIFSLRSRKLLPYINSGDFKFIKSSGTTLRLYDDIKENVNFEDEIWSKEFSATENIWIDYILDETLFKLKHFKSHLEDFNRTNRCNLSSEQVKIGILLWMNGEWFSEISQSLNIEIHQTLRFINSFLSYNVQSIIAAIIRLKELTTEDYQLPNFITNWATMLQQGVSNQMELDLFEMGLVERISVLELAKSLVIIGFEYVDYKSMKIYLLNNMAQIKKNLSSDLPGISKGKIDAFFELLKFKELI